MELKWNYGDEVLVLPASVLSADATPEQLRVLMWLASDKTLATKPAQLAKLAGCGDREDIGAIVAFWQEQGVLGNGGDTRKPSEKKKPNTKSEKAEKSAQTEAEAPAKKPLLQRADELPSYTATELADMLERSASLRVLVDESQNIFGKMFNPHELNILFGLVDYLKLSEEYILILLAHCKRIEIKSLRSVEKYAISLIDRGIETSEALEEQLQMLEERHTLEGKIRAMFGIKSRSWTAKEKKMLDAWVSHGYGEEIVRRAYEITVNATREPSLPYANTILENWHSEGLRTAEDIDRRLEEERAAKEGTRNPLTLGNSFETDDFFEAALQRSFRENDEKGL